MLKKGIVNKKFFAFLFVFLSSCFTLTMPFFSYAKSDIVCAGSFDSSLSYILESDGRTYLATQTVPGNLSLPYTETPYAFYTYDLSHFVDPNASTDKFNIQRVNFHFEISDLLLPADSVLNFKLQYRYDAGRPARLDLEGFNTQKSPGSVTLNFLGDTSKTFSFSKLQVKKLNVVQDGSDYLFTCDVNISVPTDEILTSFYLDFPAVYLNEPIGANVPSYVVGLGIVSAELFQYTDAEAMGQDVEYIEDKADQVIEDITEIQENLDGYKPSISDIESNTNMFNIVDFTVFNSYGNIFSDFMGFEVMRSTLIIVFMFMTISYILFGKKG